MRLKKTFSDIAQSFEKNAKITLEKSEELINISKLKFQISSQESYIKDVYAEIGEKIFRRYEHGSFRDKDFEEYFKKIKRARREIEEIKREISAVKKKKHCKKCDTEMNSDSEYCPKCGIKQ